MTGRKWEIVEEVLTKCRYAQHLPKLIIASASADASGDKSAAKYSEISAFLCF